MHFRAGQFIVDNSLSKFSNHLTDNLFLTSLIIISFFTRTQAIRYYFAIDTLAAVLEMHSLLLFCPSKKHVISNFFPFGYMAVIEMQWESSSVDSEVGLKKLIPAIKKQVYQKILGTLLLSVLNMSLTSTASCFDDVSIYIIAGRACLQMKPITQLVRAHVVSNIRS